MIHVEFADFSSIEYF
jgi:ADP-dependent phosphofructokinase/glucokinase